MLNNLEHSGFYLKIDQRKISHPEHLFSLYIMNTQHNQQIRVSQLTHTFDILGKYRYYSSDYPPMFLPLLLYFCSGLCLCFTCFLKKNIHNKNRPLCK